MRITTPPKSVIPLYRTHSAPSTANERQVLIRRQAAAEAVRNIEAAEMGPWSCLALLVMVLGTIGLCFLVPKPPKSP